MIHPTCLNVVSDSQRSMICTSVGEPAMTFGPPKTPRRGKVNSSLIIPAIKANKTALFCSKLPGNGSSIKSHDMIIMGFSDPDPLFIDNCSDRS